MHVNIEMIEGKLNIFKYTQNGVFLKTREHFVVEKKYTLQQQPDNLKLSFSSEEPFVS